MHPGRERRGDLLMDEFSHLRGTDAWDDTHSKGCHMVERIGTFMMLIEMIYSAVIVVMMKIVHKD